MLCFADQLAAHSISTAWPNLCIQRLMKRVADTPSMREEVAALPVNSGQGQGARYRLATAEQILGNEAAALSQVEQALEQLPIAKDPANGAINLGRAAGAYASLGRLDLALPLLARVRALDGTDLYTSAATLRIDPDYDKFRADPRFQAEVAAFAARDAKR